MDRLHFSFATAKWFFDKNITMVDTMQGNGVGIPSEIKDSKDRELLNSEIYYEQISQPTFQVMR